MLKRAWYLIDADGCVDPHDPWLAAAAAAGLALADPDEAVWSALVATEHLGVAVDGLAARPAACIDLCRLVVALNLLSGQLTQTVRRLTHHVHHHGEPGLPPRAIEAAVTSLARAALAGELVAGHLKEAYLLAHLRTGRAITPTGGDHHGQQ
jgi:hypothetical protein